jgi:hypothetical protein
MAKVARTMSGKSPLSGRAKGGKLALFEVLASSQNADEADLDEPQVAAVEPPPAPILPTPAPHITQPRRIETPPLRFPAEPPVVSSQRRVSAVTLALAAASIVAVVALVYVVGRPSAGPATTIAAVPSEVMPEVLDVNGPGARTEAGTDAALARNRQATEQTIQRLPPVTDFTVTAQRTNGLNYVLVQSYHASESDRAEATVAALAQAGVHVTIEREIPGWPKRLCIVGVEGFERIRNNTQFQTYLDRLDSVSTRHRSDHKIKTFDPQPIHWSKG